MLQQHFPLHFLSNTTMRSSALAQMQLNNYTSNSVIHLTRASAQTSPRASYRIPISLAQTSPSIDNCVAHAPTVRQVNIAVHLIHHHKHLPHNPSAPSSRSIPSCYPSHPQATTLTKSSSSMNSPATYPSSGPQPRTPKLITSTYNANNHRVSALHGDCEKINVSLAVPLGSLGIQLHASTPGEHAARVERSILTLRQLSIATLSQLPYHLPPKYTIYLHKAVASIRNSMINTRSSPHTPDELLRGTKPIRVPFQFGASCMVTQHEDKRVSLSRKHNTATNIEPKAELGVCLGPDWTTGRTLFLLANGSIVPRRPTQQLPPTFVPFDWAPKEYIINTSPTTPPSTETQTHNSVVQLPEVTVIDAISTVTGYIPALLNTDLLHSLRTVPTLLQTQTPSVPPIHNIINHPVPPSPEPVATRPAA